MARRARGRKQPEFMKRWQSILLGVVISVLTLAYALQGNDLSRIGQEAARGRYAFLLPTFAIAWLGLLLRGVRWRALLDDRIGLWPSLHIMNVGYLFNAWLPFRLGEVARSFLVTRLTPPISIFTSLSSIVAERLIDLLMVVVIIALAVSLTPVPPEVATGARASALLAVAGIIFLALLAARRNLAHWILDAAQRLLPFLRRFHLRPVVDHLLDGIAPLASVKGVARAFFWTAAAWAPSVIAGYVLLFVFYDAPRWEAALLMIAIASLAIALPAVPGSVGPFEAAIILGLQAGGMVGGDNTPERAFAFAVLLHIVNVALYAVTGWIGLSRQKISFGEVMRSARQLARRRDTEPTNADPSAASLAAPSAPTETSES